MENPEGGTRAVNEQEREQRTIRCLVAKFGLDSHNRGANVITRACRGASFEDTLDIVGGIIPKEDREEPYGLDVAEIFGHGVSMEENIHIVRKHVPVR